MSDLAALQEAVESLHRCKATFLEAVSVIEECQGERVWEGEVHIFALRGHPSTDRAYSWRTPGGRTYAVLHEGPVDSPEKAVRASIVDAVRNGENG